MCDFSKMGDLECTYVIPQMESSHSSLETCVQDDVDAESSSYELTALAAASDI